MDLLRDFDSLDGPVFTNLGRATPSFALPSALAGRLRGVYM